MKRIILLLTTFVSFAFSNCYNYDNFMPDITVINSQNAPYENFTIGTTLIDGVSHNTGKPYKCNSPESYNYKYFDSDKFGYVIHSFVGVYCYKYSYQYTYGGSCTPTPTCTENEEEWNNTCVPKCNGVNNHRLTDGSCSNCTYATSMREGATCNCLAIGSKYTPGPVISSIGALDGVDFEYADIKCDDGTSIQVFGKITAEYEPEDPCLIADSWSPIPVGMIYKEAVASDSICASYVDNINYIVPYQTRLVDSDCPSDTRLYCYLTPKNLDTNNTQVDNNDYTLSNSIDPTSILNPDLNLSTQSQVTNHQLSQILSTDKNIDINIKKQLDTVKQNNLLLSSFTNDFKDYYTWSKSSSNSLQATLTDEGRKLLEGLQSSDKNNTKDITRALKATTNAVDRLKGTINVQTIELGTKLDQIKDVLTSDNNNSSSNLDMNITNSKIDTLIGFFDTNSSVDFDFNVSNNYSLTDLLPSESWFIDNSLNIDINNYTGECYLETVEILGVQLINQEVLNKIPFDIISGLAMSFIYLLGLRDFLRS